MTQLSASDVEIRVHGEGGLFGCFFLMESLVLHVVVGCERHHRALEIAGIEACDLLLFGNFLGTNVVVRDEWGHGLSRPVQSILKSHLASMQAEVPQ